jgi:hypothetical protein
MDTTSNLLLPFIMPQQAQKFVSHNEALNALDALVMLAVVGRTSTSPPGAPAEGDRYIVADGATGAWTGKDTCVAAWQNGAWSFFAPRPGWLAWCAAESQLVVYESGWSPANSWQNIPEIGVNTTASSTNRLAVAAPATLLTHAGSDHRLVVNKQASGNTASLLFQDNFSGRAEIGLTGNDQLSINVSADGSSFRPAMTIDSASAAIAFPGTNLLTDYAANLYQDSGRMAGNGVTANLIGAYGFPAYFSLTNGATQASLAKYIYNNTDNGGSAGTLDSNVADLINMIRSPSYRRYGPEFWVAKITAGAGTGLAPTSAGGKSGYLSFYTTQQVILPAMTFHVYLRALTKEIIVAVNIAGPATGQTAFKNGVPQSANFLVSPADGWVSLTIQQKVNPYQNTGYNPSILAIYAQASGDQYLLACPALMGGLTNVDDNVGCIAGSNSWSA